MNKIAVYSGSFDPVTNGHMDIITRASQMYDELIVAILINKSKKSLFTIEDRVELLKKSTKHLPNVKVDNFSGLLVDYCKANKIYTVVRGLRMLSDFETELQMANMNYFLSQDKVDTVFLATLPKYSYISSSTVKEIATFGGSVKDFVPKVVEDALYDKLRNNNL